LYRKLDIHIRPLRENDLEDAERIFRIAFGTFFGIADPQNHVPDRRLVSTRFYGEHTTAFGAEVNGRLVGTNMGTRWGTVGFMGPLTILPDLWNRGIAKLLIGPVLGTFDHRGCRHTGLFTFASSQKHVGLYQGYGFWPRFLTVLMSRAVQERGTNPAYVRYADVTEDVRRRLIHTCFQITDRIFTGLDLTQEIAAVHGHSLGHTLFLGQGGEVDGLAVCHLGPGTEAGEDTCYIKFGAVRPGPDAGETFDRLIRACDHLAAARGMSRLTAGVNTARRHAYVRMLKRGFAIENLGIAMERPDEAGYNRPDVYVIDDWR